MFCRTDYRFGDLYRPPSLGLMICSNDPKYSENASSHHQLIVNLGERKHWTDTNLEGKALGPLQATRAPALGSYRSFTILP